VTATRARAGEKPSFRGAGSRCFLSFSLLCCVACSGAELEFADWTIPVAEGAAVFEYAPVPLDARADRVIETEYDLVLGADLSVPQQVFYRVSGVVPDSEGNIWVSDQGNRHVKVFDPSGAHVRTIGQEGQGPGEFQRLFYSAIAGGHFLAMADTRRLSLWTLDGEHVRDMQLMKSLTRFAGVEEGFVARHSTTVEESETAADEQPRENYTYSLFDLDAHELRTYAEVVQPPTWDTVALGDGDFFSIVGGGIIPSWTMRFAVAPNGVFYLTTSDEYQLHAYGSQTWSLRVAWPRADVTRQHRAIVMNTYRDALYGATESSLPWTDQFRAITNVEVDGHGHVYVFPFFPPLDAPREDGQEAPEIDRPVDIYSADGEHLFSGMISISSWTGALGDHIYLSRDNPDTDEVEVVRVRLVEPF